MAAKIPGGYILLARNIIESRIWDKPPLYLKVWVWLLQEAQHSRYNRLDRGELFCKINKIQEGVSWHIGFRKVTPTKDQIYQVIDWLRSPEQACCTTNNEGGAKATMNETMITTTKATQGMHIIISNYRH